MKASGIEVRNAVNSEGWGNGKRLLDLSFERCRQNRNQGPVRCAQYGRKSEILRLFERDVTLNIAVGHDKKSVSTSYQDLGATIKMPDGNSYTDGDLKPAWKQMGTDLNIKFNDVYKGWKTSNNLTNILQGRKRRKLCGHGYVYDRPVGCGGFCECRHQNPQPCRLSRLYAPTSKGNSSKLTPVVYLSLLQSGYEHRYG